MIKIKSNLKKVKIDEHIKKSKLSEHGSGKPGGKEKRARGRPRKSEGGSAEITNSITSHSDPRPEHRGSIEGDIPASNVPEPQVIEPVYDTTAEAKAFIETPFQMGAMLLSEPRLALYPEELEAIMPSWKVVFDKRIAPNMGENADLYMFATVMLGITAKKYAIVASRPKDKKIKEMQVETEQTHTNISQVSPGIPTMPVFGGNA